jgi:universal stress protein E
MQYNNFKQNKNMKLLEKILVPIDVNTDSTELINATIKLADAYHSEIILMYVIDDRELTDSIKEIVLKSVKESLNEINKRFIANHLKTQEPVVVFGKIVDSIVQKAYSERVNLVLIGAKEKNIREKYKLGVITEQIIRECDAPVWLVNGEKEILFSNILCPVDFSEPSKRALVNAILFARKFNANLKIITVYEPLEYISKIINIHLDEET